MLDPVTNTVIRCAWYNIHEVCIDMGCQRIIQLKDKAQNKGAMFYMDRRPKTTGIIVGFINSTQLGSTIINPTA